MKWIFLTLLLLNVFVFGMSWLDQNDSKIGKGKQFVPLENVLEIKTLSNRSTVTEVSRNDSKETCMIVGPIGVERDADILAMRLNDVKLNASKVEHELKKAPNYWVYLPPLDTRSSAMAKLKKLQAKNIDSYVISQGPIKNGISLGVFKNIDKAEEMKKIRSNQGYKVEIRNIPKSEIEFWVGIKSSYSIELANKVLSVLKENKISAEKRQILCESIASASKLP